jgi:predicted GIY-YIG superfamily endonuclease
MTDEERLIDWGYEDATHLMGKCIYALLDGDKIVYIGRTRSVLRRVWQHQGRLKFDRVFVKPVTEMCEEQTAIHIFQPVGNVSGVEKIKRMTQAEIKEEANRILVEAGLRKEPLIRRA